LKPAKEQQEKKIDWKQKFVQKEQNNCREQEFNNICKRKEDLNNRPRLKKHNFKQLSQNKES
jgi:hypothetical protein